MDRDGVCDGLDQTRLLARDQDSETESDQSVPLALRQTRQSDSQSRPTVALLLFPYPAEPLNQLCGELFLPQIRASLDNDGYDLHDQPGLSS